MADEQKKIIVLGIELDLTQLIKAAQSARRELDSLKAARKQLVDSGKQNTVEFEENAAAIRKASEALKLSLREIDNTRKAQDENTGSIKQMRAELSLATENYNKLSEAERTGTDEGRKLQAEIKGLSDKLKEQESAIGDTRRNVGNYKEALRDLEKQLAGMTVGSAEFNKTAAEAGKLRDQINDAREASRTFTSGSQFTIVNNSIKGIGDSLKNLDFAEALEKSNTLVAITKQLTFKEAISGLASLRDTFINLGRSLLTNPLFLLAAAIGAVVAGIISLKNSMEDATKAAEENAEALDKVTDATKKVTDANKQLQIEVDVASGKITETEGQKLSAKNKFVAEYTKVLEEQRAAEKRINDQSDKLLDDHLFAGSLRLARAAGVQIGIEKDREIALTANQTAFNERKVALQKNLNLELQKINADAAAQAAKDAENADKTGGGKSGADDAKQRADAQRAAQLLILEDQKAAIQLRLLAESQYNKQYLDDKIKLFETERDIELASSDLTANQKLLVIEETNQKIKQAQQQFVVDTERLAAESLQKRFGELESITEKQDLEHATQLLNQKTFLTEQLIAGVLSQDEYDKQVADLETQALADSRQRKLDEINDKLLYVKEGSDEELKLLNEKAVIENQIVTDTERKKRDELDRTQKIREQKTKNEIDTMRALGEAGKKIFKEGSDAYQAFSLLEAAASTSSAAIGAYKQAVSTYPPPLGPILGGITAAAAVAFGVIQQANIKALEDGGIAWADTGERWPQIWPKAARGMLIGGEPHSRGGTKFWGSDGSAFEAERDEMMFVLNKRSTTMLRSLNNINVAGGGVDVFEHGGIPSMNPGRVFLADGGLAARAAAQPVIQQAQQAVNVTMPKIVVAVQDINDAQGELVEVEQRAEI